MSRFTARPPDPDAEFDALLRAALRARPEPLASSNLAERVMARARVSRSAASVMATRRVQRVQRLASLAAVLAICAVLALGATRWMSIEAARESYESAASVMSASSEFGTLLRVGGGGFIATMAYLALRGSLSRDEANDAFVQ